MCVFWETTFCEPMSSTSRFKFCHTILSSLSTEMGQSCLSLPIAHWVHERILMSTFRWLAPKKWYGKPVTFVFYKTQVQMIPQLKCLCNIFHLWLKVRSLQVNGNAKNIYLNLNFVPLCTVRMDNLGKPVTRHSATGCNVWTSVYIDT